MANSLYYMGFIRFHSNGMGREAQLTIVTNRHTGTAALPATQVR